MNRVSNNTNLGNGNVHAEAPLLNKNHRESPTQVFSEQDITTTKAIDMDTSLVSPPAKEENTCNEDGTTNVQKTTISATEVSDAPTPSMVMKEICTANATKDAAETLFCTGTNQ